MQTYDKLAEEWDRLRKQPKQEWRQFLDYVNQGDKVLDIGCGNGRLFEILKSRNVQYTGVDSCEELIKLAKLNQESGIRNQDVKSGQMSNVKCQMSFRVADMRSLPFTDYSFNVVFCLASFHHLESLDDRQRVLLEIMRVLKPGGYLIMQNWNLMYLPFLFKHRLWHLLSPYSLFSILYSLDRRACQIPWKLPTGEVVERYYYSFTLGELALLVKGAGFNIQHLYYDNKGKAAHWFNGRNLTLIARS